MKITKKIVENWLNETLTEDWKYHKEGLKNMGINNKKEWLELSSEIFNAEGEDIIWASGYISALKAVLENLNRE